MKNTHIQLKFSHKQNAKLKHRKNYEKFWQKLVSFDTKGAIGESVSRLWEHEVREMHRRGIYLRWSLKSRTVLPHHNIIPVWSYIKKYSTSLPHPGPSAPSIHYRLSQYFYLLYFLFLSKVSVSAGERSLRTGVRERARTALRESRVRIEDLLRRRKVESGCGPGSS